MISSYYGKQVIYVIWMVLSVNEMRFFFFFPHLEKVFKHLGKDEIFPVQVDGGKTNRGERCGSTARPLTPSLITPG